MSNTKYDCGCPEMLCGHRTPPDPNWVPIHVPQLKRRTSPKINERMRNNALLVRKMHNKRRYLASLRENSPSWLASQAEFDKFYSQDE